MRLVLLFVGLLSLLFFNSKGYPISQNHQNFLEEVNLCCFEAAQAEAIWGFEKTESSQYNISEQKISQGKKREFNSLQNFSGVTSRLFSFCSNYNSTIWVQLNLFLFYHFSQSLWQVFLL
jgi:hypothetical protein